MRDEDRRLIGLCAVVFLTTVSLFVAMPEVGPLLFEHGQDAIVPAGMSPEARQWLFVAAIAAPQVSAAIGGPLLGTISDRRGRKPILVAALAAGMASAAVAAYGVSMHQIALLVAALALLGLTDSRFIAMAAILEDSAPSATATRVGLVTATSLLGFVVGPLIGGMCSELSFLPISSFATPFCLAAALFLITLLLTALFYQERQADAGADRRGEQSPLTVMRAAMAERAAASMLGLFMLMELAFACYYEIVPLQLIGLGYSAVPIGVFAASVAGLIAAISVLGVPRLLRHVAEHHALTGAFGLIAMAGLMVLLRADEVVVWLSGLPMAGGTAVIYCLAVSRLSRWAGRGRQATVSGLLNTIGAATLIAGSVIVGGGRVGSSASAAGAMVAASIFGMYWATRRSTAAALRASEPIAEACEVSTSV